MKILDFTIDFETCALTPDAAIMSIGAIAWKRFETNPFFSDNEKFDSYFYVRVNLTEEFVNGFRFDNATSSWWAEQSPNAKISVIGDGTFLPVKNCLESLFIWIKDVCKINGAEKACLWSQGSDFDLAILRNICSKYNIEIPLKYTSFRDHRTFILECGALAFGCAQDKVYESIKDSVETLKKSLTDDYLFVNGKHDPVYDCANSIINTCVIMNKLTETIQNNKQ